jgi:hypothetical protein
MRERVSEDARGSWRKNPAAYVEGVAFVKYVTDIA